MGQDASHGGDCFGWTKTATQATEFRPEIALACPKRGGSHAESRRCAIDDLPRSPLQNSPSAQVVGGAEPEPGGEMILTRPAAHIQSHFADDCLPCHHIDPVY